MSGIDLINVGTLNAAKLLGWDKNLGLVQERTQSPLIQLPLRFPLGTLFRSHVLQAFSA